MRLIGFHLVTLIATSALAASAPGKVEFNRDVRPILADTCFKCHGLDKNARKADLRLDIRDEAIKPHGDDQLVPIVPGNLDKSEAWQRIISDDSNDLMPPPESHLTITDAQKETLKKWIEQGAEYQPHWAFVPIKRPSIPQVKNQAWIRNGIDAFILARLESENLEPSPQADRATLIRRVTFDLTGLPPTPAEVDAFANDQSPHAYEKVVDRLLDSPQYGERMTLDWLDEARYGDTHGFNNDTLRSMWPWRDWVIHAFNANMPYNEFLTEQLAGDLIPNATRSQKIATGFNRNQVYNSEGGIIGEEYREDYVLDRTTTAGNVFMGLTVQCARCHDHKYDPITQKDFYSLTAFFDQLDEVGQIGVLSDPQPLLQVPTKAQAKELAEATAAVAPLEKIRADHIKLADNTRTTWEPKLRATMKPRSPTTQGLIAYLPFDDTKPTNAAPPTTQATTTPTSQPAIKGRSIGTRGPIDHALKLDGKTIVDLGNRIANFGRTDKFSLGAWFRATSNDPGTIIGRMDEAAAERGYDLLFVQGRLEAHIINSWPTNAIYVTTTNPLPINEWHHAFVTYDGSGKAAGVKIYIDGEPAPVNIGADTLKGDAKANTPLLIGRRSAGVNFKGSIDEVRIYDRALTATEVDNVIGIDPLAPLLAIDPAKRTPAEQNRLRDVYLTKLDKDFTANQTKLDAAKKHEAEVNAAIPTVMVMQDMPKPRKTFILKRGQYDAPLDEVHANTPSFLPPMPKDAPHNRLGLAEWLTDPRHPLTARVAVNRLWYQDFGVGIVKTLEDWGIQGEPPSHPELLDWLASQFIRSGWDIKAMQRLIVTSATYRQEARYTAELNERDPENRLLARGPRQRLAAEAIRDNALAVSGLLVENIGGPSVMPYQPAGLWDDVIVGANYPGTKYTQGHGDDLYRRSMYTFWKRTCPPPMLSAFDAPDRETCLIRRPATNTPLQALALLNDPTFIEASRKLAERMMQEAGPTPAAKVAFVFKLATAHQPTNEELKILCDTYTRRLAAYQSNPKLANKLLAIGESKSNAKLDQPQLAAYTTVASMVLNLDETITK